MCCARQLSGCALRWTTRPTDLEAGFESLAQALIRTNSVETTLVEFGFDPEASAQPLKSLLGLNASGE
jgi:hypothetical protein